MIADALLDLLVSQGAQSLVLEPQQPPCLIRGGEPRPLSMPPLDDGTFEAVVATVASPEEVEGLGAGATLRRSYTSGGKTFDVALARAGEGARITFSVPGTSESEAASAEPVAASTPPRVAPASSVSVDASEAPAVLQRVLQRAQVQEASDVFISVGRDARLRVGGELTVVEGTAVDDDGLLALLGSAWDDAHRQRLEDTGSTDLPLEHAGVRYRVNVFRQTGGLAAALRPIRGDAPTLAELGLPDSFRQLVEHRNGLVLMTGTAGSGKSTTLVSLLEYINRTQPKHVITLEDPIEYTYQPAAALIHQREIGAHVESFGAGLRAALRESPDIILVGEMRDRETIAAALTAAETGHLVLSTLHCGDAAMAVDRIVDVFPEHQQSQVREQVAGVLRAVVTQVLLPSLHPPRRVVAFEKLVVNTAVATKIRERRVHQIRSELHTGQAAGMVPLELTLAQLVRQRRVSKALARATAHDPELLEEHLRGQSGR